MSLFKVTLGRLLGLFILPMGIISSLFALLACSPVSGVLDIPTDPKAYASFDAGTIQTKADELQSKYVGLVEDAAAAGKNPNYKQIEEKRQKLVAEASALATQFRDLADNLERGMDQGALGKALGSSPTGDTASGLLDPKAFRARSKEFQEKYTRSLDDMLSYQKDPDYKRVEEKRQKMVGEATALAAQFRDLADNLERKLGEGASGQATDPSTAGVSGLGVPDIKAFKEQSEEFRTKYTQSLNDMLSYQKDPDYQRVEEKRQKIVPEANSLASRFQGLSSNLLERLGQLVPNPRRRANRHRNNPLVVAWGTRGAFHLVVSPLAVRYSRRVGVAERNPPHPTFHHGGLRFTSPTLLLLATPVIECPGVLRSLHALIAPGRHKR
ncbi:MAG: hypothetical protein Q8O76_03525 [Chloroflexota bacterium]|nr:hypothetical protein [Chloroflexota bacterium]